MRPSGLRIALAHVKRRRHLGVCTPSNQLGIKNYHKGGANSGLPCAAIVTIVSVRAGLMAVMAAAKPLFLMRFVPLTRSLKNAYRSAS